jgi:hypothetical protein
VQVSCQHDQVSDADVGNGIIECARRVEDHYAKLASDILIDAVDTHAPFRNDSKAWGRTEDPSSEVVISGNYAVEAG